MRNFHHEKTPTSQHFSSLVSGKSTGTFFSRIGSMRISDRLKNFWGLLKDTFSQWSDREPFNNSIIIAYYTIFSLPGLLVIIINVAGYFYDKKEVTRRITGQIESMIGGDTAADVQNIVDKASETKGTVVSSILGIATLLFGAT